MFDIERLTDDEKYKFDQKYSQLVEQIMIQISMLPPKDQIINCGYNYRINYRLFDFEAVVKLRVDLLEYL